MRVLPSLDAGALRAHFTGGLGTAVYVFDSVASTMSVARALARAGVGHGAVVLANEQTAGHGRRGRGWWSPPGVGLYMSVLLATERARPGTLPLSLLTGVAVADALRSQCNVDAALKWPNDVILGAAKVAGVLVEVTGAVVVVGVGVNVHNRRDELPTDVPYPVTSLELAGGTRLDRNVLGAAVIHELENRLAEAREAGPAAVISAWLARNVTLGRRIYSVDADITGVAVDVDAAGALIVQNDHGRRYTVRAGDVLLDYP